MKPSPCRTVEWAPSQPISQSAASVSLSPLALRSTASNLVALVGEALQRDGALDLDAALGELLLEDALGVALGDHQRVGIGAVDVVEADPRDDVLAVRHLRAMRLHAGRQERIDVAGMVEQLQRAAPQHQGFRLVGPFGRLVDDADRDAVSAPAHSPSSGRQGLPQR